MIIRTDPSLTASEGDAVFRRTFSELYAAARKQVAGSFDDDEAASHAEHIGEAAVARDALVRSLGGGVLEVDPDLFASALSSDDGIVVVEAGDADVNPPSVAEYSPSLAEEEAAAEAARVAADAAGAEAAAAQDQDAPPAPEKAPARKAPAKKAAAKKSSPRKAAARKASAKPTRK